LKYIREQREQVAAVHTLEVPIAAHSVVRLSPVKSQPRLRLGKTSSASTARVPAMGCMKEEGAVVATRSNP
jgi:hypothetical protein